MFFSTRCIYRNFSCGDRVFLSVPFLRVSMLPLQNTWDCARWWAFNQRFNTHDSSNMTPTPLYIQEKEMSTWQALGDEEFACATNILWSVADVIAMLPTFLSVDLMCTIISSSSTTSHVSPFATVSCLSIKSAA